MAKAGSTEKVVREIRRHTRRRFSAEEKIRIVLEGLRGEESIAALCRREGLAPNLYYRWSKACLEAGKKRLLGDTTREATSTEVQDLRRAALPRAAIGLLEPTHIDVVSQRREHPRRRVPRQGRYLPVFR